MLSYNKHKKTSFKLYTTQYALCFPLVRFNKSVNQWNTKKRLQCVNNAVKKSAVI